VANSFLRSGISVDLPIRYGDISLSLAPTGTIFSIMPFKGKTRRTASKLKNILNIDLPQPNLRASSGEIIIYSVGLDQWFITSPNTFELFSLLSDVAAITNQSDGWVKVLLTDSPDKDVLARLCPVQPVVEQVVRTKFAGMMSIVCFTESGAELFFMRSMIETAINEIDIAMKSVAAQRASNE